jgi:hypothetical protein
MALHPDALVVLPGGGPGQLHADRALIDAGSKSGAIRPVIAVVAIVIRDSEKFDDVQENLVAIQSGRK